MRILLAYSEAIIDDQVDTCAAIHLMNIPYTETVLRVLRKKGYASMGDTYGSKQGHDNNYSGGPMCDTCLYVP